MSTFTTPQRIRLWLPRILWYRHSTMNSLILCVGSGFRGNTTNSSRNFCRSRGHGWGSSEGIKHSFYEFKFIDAFRADWLRHGQWNMISMLLRLTGKQNDLQLIYIIYKEIPTAYYNFWGGCKCVYKNCNLFAQYRFQEVLGFGNNIDSLVSIYNYIAQLTEVNDVKESAMSRMHTEDITAKNTYVVESIVGQGRINVYSLTIPLGF